MELAPTGQQEVIINKLIEKARTWAERIRISFLKERDITTAINTTILKTLEYPLLALLLTEKECDDMLRPILHAALPKARYNRHMS